MAGSSLAGRVALVTGVSRRAGIGTAIAARLRADGARVLASGWPAHDAAMPWGADPDAAHEEWIAADLADAAAPHSLVAEACRRFGRIDVVVANHARSSAQGLLQVTADELDLSFAVNARALVLLARALAELRPAGPGGRLILFTSGQGQGPMPDQLPYALSKGAVQAITLSLADALAERGITVNCINPGPVDTGWATGELHARVARRFPTGSWSTPEDSARVVAWLASDEAARVSGQTIHAEGGFRRG